MQNQKENFITLKEASKISGYAPDYVGQLIRKGKLPGKQVFCNVAWMTTEEAVREYMKQGEIKGSAQADKQTFGEWLRGAKSRIVFQFEMAKLFKAVLYFVIIASLGFSLLLFFIFSVSIDRKINDRVLEQAAVEINSK